MQSEEGEWEVSRKGSRRGRVGGLCGRQDASSSEPAKEGLQERVTPRGHA